MITPWHIPRNALTWILLSLLLLVPAHYDHLPWWALLVCLVVAGWRIMILRGEWGLPSIWIKLLLVLLSVAGIYQQFGGITGLEPMVALLFCGFSLKLLECSSRRDVYLVLFLAYLVAASAFLFSQQITFSLYMLLCVLVITAALVALHQPNVSEFSLSGLYKATVILLQAIPLTVVLFLVLPRFEPLWSVPAPSHQARTGMSDTMSPGDISALGRSDQLVFRAEFESGIPSSRQLYWRGLTLSDFDGRTWHRGPENMRFLTPRESQSVRQRFSQPINYKLIIEPNNQYWIFSLPLAFTDNPKVKMASDSRLVSIQQIGSRMQLDVLSDPDERLQSFMDIQQRALYTELPASGNPRTREWAQRLLDQAGNEVIFVQQMLDYFSREAFFYTLEPPLLGRDSVDEFIFDTRRGFCEHYASSFVFAVRSAGIPARVVAGYQGGDVNPLTGVVSVRQYDAHAWAEVWLEDQGWVRVDPTGAVSPLRIESGLQRAMEAVAEEFLPDDFQSPYRYRDIPWINQLRLRYEMLNYQWTKWVLNYRGQLQIDVMKRLLGDITAWRIAVLLLLVTLLASLPFLYRAWLHGRHLEPHQRLYLKICRMLEKQGYERQPNETPDEFAHRVAQDAPAWGPSLQLVTGLFTRLEYESVPEQEREQALKNLKHELFKLRYKRVWK
ncbi:hypothetical protein BOW14_11040 [Solemya velum gill symbiont]|uniref:transglutaminase TgpA family protein n=1 Tax=Solemya velum gill symbiont TaxID=2340 RepID=UPI0009978F2A|nr:DUF3488 and transglutaminase-like domain-containing protein [Solemya velum gill symbiont]OOY85007.1 hypothetical protein BOW14_11040 [Solemya velum gill symbiont]